MPLQRSTLVCMSCFVIGFPLLGITVPVGLFRNCYGFPIEAPLAPHSFVGIVVPVVHILQDNSLEAS
jgi:hypothetical protein